MCEREIPELWQLEITMKVVYSCVLGDKEQFECLCSIYSSQRVCLYTVSLHKTSTKFLLLCPCIFHFCIFEKEKNKIKIWPQLSTLVAVALREHGPFVGYVFVLLPQYIHAAC